jgi:hypothetical protein
LKSHSDILDSLQKYFYKLQRNLVYGEWEKYKQPIELIKRYYGERFAFYFMFFCTYQAHVIIPSFFGLILAIW